MNFKTFTGALLGASLAFVPAQTAQADAGDFIAGAIIGGIVGANAKKQRTTRTTQKRYKKKTYRSRLPSTQEGRNIQASLNYFGFNAGTVDGQLGQKTRNAVSQYQAYLGYPVTGQLSAFENNLLVSSYNRAQAGGYAVQQQVAATPDGTRGLLKTYRAEMAGQSPAGNGAAQTTIVVAPQAVPQPAPTTPVIAAAAASATALPSFMGAASQASLASHCNTVSLITNTNGGFTTLASMSDPNVAINEQFCLARTYAIARSEELVGKIPGFTPDQIAQQCAGFGPAMKDYVSSLSLKSRDAVVADVSSFVLTTGMSPAQLAGTARICMGVGYRTDNMEVAVGSALLLYTMGEGVYGELMGHHLSQGFGTAKRADKAVDWYKAGLAAADSGAATVFVPGQPERTELIRAASQRITGAASVPTFPQPQAASSTGLPTFSISE
ncbi:peptidoglycan-binding protein [Sulfitobacter sp. M57]|uniref:peptidoglycan-binding domain-containing protein n=1 Tax=unclassified Sulfitobacter TaxID=196795 RepID=UPI0023E20B8E|nr:MULTISPECIES: peptidoglycan-binding domain-containing protein [unclassified Sulfitobacter]MDF3413212.1 peptidoglycan-binding protein [Sulfitobacter sp. KE5]MDF3421505.1 peptidoglycan-binding protein [Sulfitobacter sp. KE43]MDF3431761.1 peptidoglycan-binding protein [Sulfitobacter sp. KE42]MDF3457401.1 peptidoglycan-binding protein [Sulfitobacter sp. S74]MDF3461304.1 peptidoglycan-binding protein [Sulfitobacter sp. Ks18]